jgi:hypothetical protein
MKPLFIALVASLVLASAAHAKDINPTLQEIIKANGGCVPRSIISFKEAGRLREKNVELKDCVDPKLLSEEELTRDRTYEAEKLRHPPTVMTASWLEKDIKDYHRTTLDPLFSKLPECKGVRVIHLPDSTNNIADVQLAAQNIIQRNPLVVTFSLGDHNVFDSFPDTAVRLACLVAKGKNRSW